MTDDIYDLRDTSSQSVRIASIDIDILNLIWFV